MFPMIQWALMVVALGNPPSTPTPIPVIQVRARPLTQEIRGHLRTYKLLRKQYQLNCAKTEGRPPNPVKGKWAQKTQLEVDESLTQIQKDVARLAENLDNPPDPGRRKIEIQVKAARERFQSELGMLEYLSYKPDSERYLMQKQLVAEVRQKKEVLEKLLIRATDPKRVARIKNRETRRMLQEMEQLVKISDRYVKFQIELRGCEASQLELGRLEIPTPYPTALPVETLTPVAPPSAPVPGVTP